MGDKSTTNRALLIQEEFLKDFLSETDTPTSFDESSSRFLLSWDNYIQLYRAIKIDDAAGSKLIEKNTKLVKKIIADPSVTNRTDWSTILCLMLSPASHKGNGEHRELHKDLRRLYAQHNDEEGKKNEKETGGRKYITDKIQFPYRFTAAFQDWITHHLQDEEYLRKNQFSPEICQDCKANVPPGSPTNDILYLFYTDISSTSQTFQSIFGRAPRDIHGQDYLRNTLPQIPLLLKYFPLDEFDKPECQLWSELIWLMDEIENLTTVHARVQQAQKRMEILLSKASEPEEMPVNVFKEDKKLAKWLFKRLRVNQFSLFVSKISNKRLDNKIAFETTMAIEKKLNIHLASPYLSPDQKGKTQIFDEVIEKLFEDTLDSSFFKNIEETASSPTDKDRTFPFIVIPDGEVNFYYSLMLHNQKGKQLKYSLEDYSNFFKDTISTNPTDFWRNQKWWISKKGTGGIFPSTGDKSLHHRCCSYVSVAQMCSGGQKERLENFKCALEAIRTTFCKGDPPEESLGNVYSKPCSNNECDNYGDCQNRENARNIGDLYTFNDLITLPRISYLPEMILRAEEAEAHTLFFLPMGAKARKTDIESYHPISMIAGTLRGVEKRWLPFNSYRMVAHLYPLIRILQPLLDKLTREIYLDGNLIIERERQEIARSKHFEEQFKLMVNSIISLSSAADKIKKDIVPAPLLFLDEDFSKNLGNKIFNSSQQEFHIRKPSKPGYGPLHLKTHGIKQPKNKHGRWTFKPIHEEKDIEVGTTDLPTYVSDLLEIMKDDLDDGFTTEYSHDLTRYLISPLSEIIKSHEQSISNSELSESEVTVIKEYLHSTCSKIFNLLKSYIHNTYNPRNSSISIQLFLITIYMTIWDTKLTNRIKVKVNGNDYNPEKTSTWHSILEKILNLQDIQVPPSSQWKLHGIGYLYRAFYNLLSGPLNPNNNRPGTQGNKYAHIDQIHINYTDSETDKDKVPAHFTLVLYGANCFESEESFHAPKLDSRTHNFSDNVAIFEAAVGSNVKLYDMDKKNPDYKQILTEMSAFAVCQWREQEKFEMHIKFGD